jgi:hypothetical protein
MSSELVIQRALLRANHALLISTLITNTLNLN